MVKFQLYVCKKRVLNTTKLFKLCYMLLKLFYISQQWINRSGKGLRPLSIRSMIRFLLHGYEKN